MPANTTPIYPNVPRFDFCPAVKTANTARDGTGNMDVFFTANATNGGRVDKIEGWALGTNIATVFRVFVNNGGSAETATNNCLFREYTCAATTASEVAALVQSFAETFTNLVLPLNFRLLAAVGTTIAAGIQPKAIGGDY